MTPDHYMKNDVFHQTSIWFHMMFCLENKGTWHHPCKWAHPGIDWMRLKPWRSTPWSLRGPRRCPVVCRLTAGGWWNARCEEKSCWYQNCKKTVNTVGFLEASNFFLKVSEGLWRNQQWFWSLFFSVFLWVRVAGSIKKIMLTTPMNAHSIDTTSTFQSSERASTSESQLGVMLHRNCWKIHRPPGRAQFWLVQV